MSPPKTHARAARLLGGAMLAAAMSTGVAHAQAAADVGFTDSPLNIQVRDDQTARLTTPEQTRESADPRRLELELAAGGERTGLGVDVAVAQRASLGANRDGDVDRYGRGAELRVGNLVERRDDGDRRGSRFYAFAASDDEALTWQPGQRTELGARGSSWALQDQVEIGDMSAGVTYERNGVQASLAYVEREVSTTVGTQTASRDESFAGLTLTMRR